MKPRLFSVVLLSLFLVAALSCKKSTTTGGSMNRESFGNAPDGTPVYLYTIKNFYGMEAKITNFGGIVVSLKVPDRHGKLDDVVLGFDNPLDYVKNHSYFGALIGRY